MAFLIEDSAEIRDSLIPAMEELGGLKVVGHAETERDAVEWLSSHPDDWSIAIVDLFLKEGSGLGILARNAGRKAHQRLVVLTNYATQDMRERCRKLGADAVFDKSNELDGFFEYCLAQQRPSHRSPG